MGCSSDRFGGGFRLEACPDAGHIASRKGYGEEDQPLPYAVRNILVHKKDPNTLDEEGKDISNSITLLESWLK